MAPIHLKARVRLIDGEQYYVIGQGGGKGSLLFFPKEFLDRDPGGDAHPVLMGDVSQVLSDGSTAPIYGHPSLGNIYGKRYHLELGNEGLWRVIPGPGDSDN
jgi:hypothetical protein